MAVVAMLSMFAVVTGCGSDASGTGSDPTISSVMTNDANTIPGDVAVPKALLTAPGWTLLEAIEGPGVIGGTQPAPAEWFSEYQRLEPDTQGRVGSALKLSGINLSLDAYRSAMERLGVTFRDINTAWGPGLSGTTAETGARPVIIAVPIGGGTLELLSYDESANQLLALLGDLATVDDAGWRAAGGTTR
ncbi:MAG: hypothetical protein WCJ88_11335 [Actinomycetes bacterium]